MGDQNIILPDYFDLEDQRSELIETTLNTSSATLRVFSYYKYFRNILEYRDQKIEDAFLKEFIEDYISAITRFEVWGIDPEFSNKLIEQLSELKKKDLISAYQEKLSSIIRNIEEQIKELLNILDGKEGIPDGNFPAYFPLIEKNTDPSFYGIIDSVTIRISRASKDNKFIIVPGEKSNDLRIEQCENCWQIALMKLSHYIKKLFRYHEVIINFEKGEGYYEGNSLGIALTISFLDQLLKFYNPVYSINIINRIAFTGAVTKEGMAISTGDKIILQKVSTVFFSEIKTFIIPKSDEISALNHLNKLKKKYPNRELEVIPVESITDILNRRNIVDIKKRNIIVRSGKVIRKYWISAVVVILLTILFTFYLTQDFDDNPAILTADSSTLFIRNKNDKILWSKKWVFDSKIHMSEKYIGTFAKIIDINSDRQNELIIVGGLDVASDNLDENKKIRCYNKNKKILWSYTFIDKVNSKREKLTDQYTSILLDTITVFGKKSLFLIAKNGPSFSSAIYRLDLKTGKRLPGTFWTSGHIMDGYIQDIDKDKKPDILSLGADNGYEDLVFSICEIDTLTQVRPTTDEYLIQDFPIAKMKAYIRFPKNDFDNYKKIRIPTCLISDLVIDNSQKRILFGSAIPPDYVELQLGYEFNFNLKDVDVNVSNNFRVQRDTLVAHEILKPPYTDTQEYRNIIKNNILYWKDGKWVKRNEMD
jgi:hypothetical protein